MKKYILFSALVYAIIYIIAAFVEWDLMWISNISQWGEDGRCFFIFSCICKEIVCLFIWDTTDVRNVFQY